MNEQQKASELTKSDVERSVMCGMPKAKLAATEEAKRIGNEIEALCKRENASLTIEDESISITVKIFDDVGTPFYAGYSIDSICPDEF